MGVLIRTADLSPARRRAAWRETVCEMLGPLELLGFLVTVAEGLRGP
jgi:hypothetical protein